MKKEADNLAKVFVSCLENTLVQHLTEDGLCLKLNGFGKFIVRHATVFPTLFWIEPLAVSPGWRIATD